MQILSITNNDLEDIVKLMRNDSCIQDFKMDRNPCRIIVFNVNLLRAVIKRITTPKKIYLIFLS